jgi:hypothetical protein
MTTIHYKILLHKFDDDIVHQIMSYHCNYKYWKSKFKASLVHIDNLFFYSNCHFHFTIGTLEFGRSILFDNDCSDSCLIKHQITIKTAYTWLIQNLLGRIKRLRDVYIEFN